MIKKKKILLDLGKRGGGGRKSPFVPALPPMGYIPGRKCIQDPGQL